MTNRANSDCFPDNPVSLSTVRQQVYHVFSGNQICQSFRCRECTQKLVLIEDYHDKTTQPSETGKPEGTKAQGTKATGGKVDVSLTGSFARLLSRHDCRAERLKAIAKEVRQHKVFCISPIATYESQLEEVEITFQAVA